MKRLALAGLLGAGALALAPGAAQAARSCQVPGDGEWQRATPAEAGMNREKLQEAVDYGSQNQAFAVRVFRRGCLVVR